MSESRFGFLGQALPDERLPRSLRVDQVSVPCPVCGKPCSERSCPDCGHDLLSGNPTAPHPIGMGWVAVAQADPTYYESVTATGDLEAPRVPFPRDWAPRYFALDGDRAWIGRRGKGRTHRPEIDLGGSPSDPGVSRLHALLLALPEGGWALMDPGSAAGTTVNDSATPIPVDALVPIGAGDRIHLGAWTTVMLQWVGPSW